MKSESIADYRGSVESALCLRLLRSPASRWSLVIHKCSGCLIIAADKGLEILSESIGSSFIEGQLNPHSVRNCFILQPAGGVCGSQVFRCLIISADKGLEILSECIGSSYREGQLNPHSV